MAKGDDIQEKLIDFAASIIQLTTNLPKSPAAKHIANQILRSGTSPASNYAEARSAESPKDFIHKLRVALKELNETGVWLKIMIRSRMMPASQCSEIQRKCNELCRIICASVKTAANRNGRNRAANRLSVLNG